MKHVSIGDFVERVQTWNPQKEGGNSPFQYIDIGAVSQTEKTITEVQTVRAADAPSRARQIVRAGDILVSTVRPNLNAVAVVPDDLDGATASTGFTVLRPNERKLSGNFLFHWVRSPAFITEMIKLATGQSYPAVSDKIVKASKVPLFPLDEQKRIAEILDQADALRRLRSRALDKLNTLGQAVFHEMFGDVLANPKGLPRAPLASVATFTSGATPSKSEPAFWESGNIPWITPKDMKVYELVDAIDKVTPEAVSRTSLKLIPSGTPLIVVRGMILAHTVPMGITRAPCTINQDMKAINFSEQLMPEFGLYCLLAQHSALLKRVDTAAHGTKRLDLDRLGEAPILVPSIDEQREFLAALVTSASTIASNRLAKQREARLFDSLQHRAFNGEL